MAASTHYAIPRILWLVEQLKPRRILDVGCGRGKYGLLFRFILEEALGEGSEQEILIDGIDAFRPNLSHWHQVYNEVFVGDVRELAPTLREYDLIYLGDIIEHLEKEEGRALLNALIPRARMGVLLSTPYHFFEQGATAGNEFNRHRSLWTRRDFKRFPHSRCWVEYRRKLVGLISSVPVPHLADERFQRPLLSSALEHGLFSVFGFSLARRLKQIATGLGPEGSVPSARTERADESCGVGADGRT